MNVNETELEVPFEEAQRNAMEHAYVIAPNWQGDLILFAILAAALIGFLSIVWFVLA